MKRSHELVDDLRVNVAAVERRVRSGSFWRLRMK